MQSADCGQPFRRPRRGGDAADRTAHAAVQRAARRIDPDAPVAEYAFDLPGDNAGDYDVVVEALPTHPITPEHQLVCAIAFNDDPPRIVRFEHSSDERNRTWQQNVLRNATTARTTVRLQPGKHVLRLLGVDASVSIQGVQILAPADRSSSSHPQ
ncbi:MAG TPA: hypothetical protein VGR35_22055 [Tepidisphaeraceae bacterium]|nr:hypothetical protein [Tepidisphaeraceae bacterium]